MPQSHPHASQRRVFLIDTFHFPALFLPPACTYCFSIAIVKAVVSLEVSVSAKPCIIWGRAVVWGTKEALFGARESLPPPAAACLQEAALPPSYFPLPCSSGLSNYKSPNENETCMSYIMRRSSTAGKKKKKSVKLQYQCERERYEPSFPRREFESA